MVPKLFLFLSLINCCLCLVYADETEDEDAIPERVEDAKKKDYLTWRSDLVRLKELLRIEKLKEIDSKS